MTKFHKFQVVGIITSSMPERIYFRGVVVQKAILAEFDTYEMATNFAKGCSSGEYQITEICSIVDIGITVQTVLNVIGHD